MEPSLGNDGDEDHRSRPEPLQLDFINAYPISWKNNDNESRNNSERFNPRSRSTASLFEV